MSHDHYADVLREEIAQLHASIIQLNTLRTARHAEAKENGYNHRYIDQSYDAMVKDAEKEIASKTRELSKRAKRAEKMSAYPNAPKSSTY
jgi:hypothetical protein